jgi:hypothetical protein
MRAGIFKPHQTLSGDACFGVLNPACHRTMPRYFTEIEISGTTEVTCRFVDPDLDNFI